jgi:hypothetical protein
MAGSTVAAAAHIFQQVRAKWWAVKFKCYPLCAATREIKWYKVRETVAR